MNGNLFEPASPAASADWLTAHCDGGSRGNPGPSGYGAVIEDSKGRTVAELSEFLGIQTNNYAEYSGLLAVLRWAIENNAPRLRVVSDSELMVKQMQGKYAVKSPVLLPLFQEAKKLARRIETFEMRHTLRGGGHEPVVRVRSLRRLEDAQRVGHREISVPGGAGGARNHPVAGDPLDGPTDCLPQMARREGRSEEIRILVRRAGGRFQQIPAVIEQLCGRLPLVDVGHEPTVVDRFKHRQILKLGWSP